jgi:FkbM family methyltransferase
MTTRFYDAINRMVDNGLAINNVYDIGACLGEWSTETKKNCLTDSTFFLFEANERYVSVLKETGFYFFSTLLSSPGKGVVKFYNGTNTGDSYYKETTTWYDDQESINVQSYTLDQIIAEHKLPIPDFIKLDTQGSELDILLGAESIIDKVSVVHVECPIVEYNAGAPGIQNYLDYFKSKNFIPIDVTEVHVAEDTLLQIDILFVRRDVKEKYLQPNNFIRV